MDIGRVGYAARWAATPPQSSKRGASAKSNMGSPTDRSTGLRVVNLIVTELAVIEVTASGLVLQEIASETTVEKVQTATGANLVILDTVGTF